MAICVPLIFGCLRVWGEREGLYGAMFGLALFTTCNVVLLSVVLWQTGAWINRGEEVVRAGERRYRELMEALPQLVLTWLPDGTCDCPSSRSDDFTGIPLTVKAGDAWLRQIHADDRARARDWSTETFPHAVEIRIIGVDGVYRWFHARSQPIYDGGKDPAKWLGTFTDIDSEKKTRQQIRRALREEIAVEAMRHGATDYFLKDRTVRLPSAVERALKEKQLLIERKESELALRESESRFRQIAENIQEVFCVSDPLTGTILYVSPAFETIWGRSCEDLLSNSSDWLKTIHPEDRPRVAAAYEKQAEGGYDQTYRIVRPGGAIRWVRARSFPIKDTQGEVYRIIGTAEDITENRRLEEQLRQSQKLEAIGTLSGGIAHDFNNILGGIIGYAELAKINLANHPLANSHLDSLLQGANRAAMLVKQIMTFGRQQDYQRIPLQIDTVVQETMQLLRATVPSSVRFEVCLNPGMPTVLADATQVHQIIMNLCTNAAQAMKGGPGKLTIRGETVDIDEASLEAYGVPVSGCYICLSLSDTGCGMSAETVERIFEPFFTTKPLGEGTGLGLSAVHGIMKNHDGAVTVYSQPGEGTVFRLYFPAHEIRSGDEKKPGSQRCHGVTGNTFCSLTTSSHWCSWGVRSWSHWDTR